MIGEKCKFAPPVLCLLVALCCAARAPAQVWSEPERIRLDTIRLSGDYDPCISADNRLLFAAPLNIAGGCQGTDVVVARNAGGGVWDSVTVIPKACNPYDDLAPSINSAVDTLYFTNQYLPGGMGGWDIWYIVFTDTGWSDPINLGPPINTPANEQTPFISRDGQWMYFSSDRPDSFILEDIWRSQRQLDGSWGEPEVLGYIHVPNTSERGVLLTADNQTMYFSASVSGWSYDILVSHWTPGGWTAGERLDPPINVPDPSRERRPYISSDGDTLYFLSDRVDSIGLPRNRVYRSYRIDTTGLPAYEPFQTGIRLTCSPNPANSSITIRLSSPVDIDCATVRIYDVLGRRVRTLADCLRVRVGDTAFRWDGRDTDGDVVAAGVYLVAALLDGRRLSTKTVFVK